jgi:hypothetical protein
VKGVGRILAVKDHLAASETPPAGNGEKTADFLFGNAVHQPPALA